jgi:fructokinase
VKKILAIGEALIDFIANEVGYSVKDVKSFTPKVGGAPCNVCGAVSKLGVPSGMITMLGMDQFGDKIIEYLKENNVSTEYLYRTNEASTSLAFVSKLYNGDSNYTFFRNPGADMLLEPDKIKKLWFRNTYALHFCSVDIGPFPMRESHLKAIEYAKENDAIISFDPNIRLMLWKSEVSLKNAIHQFIPLCHILKISSDELEFITGCKDIKDALPHLFQGTVELIIYTKASDGAEAYTRLHSASVDGIKVSNVIDTTGAGDGFIGSFLAQLAKKRMSLSEIRNLDSKALYRLLDYSNRFCAKSITREGAIASYPKEDEMI